MFSFSAFSPAPTSAFSGNNAFASPTLPSLGRKRENEFDTFAHTNNPFLASQQQQQQQQQQQYDCEYAHEYEQARKSRRTESESSFSFAHTHTHTLPLPPPSPTSVSLSPEQFTAGRNSLTHTHTHTHHGVGGSLFAATANSAFTTVQPRVSHARIHAQPHQSLLAHYAHSAHNMHTLHTQHNAGTQPAARPVQHWLTPDFSQHKRTTITQHTALGHAHTHAQPRESLLFTPASALSLRQCWKCARATQTALPCEQCSRFCCADSCLSPCDACGTNCCSSCAMVDYSRHFENRFCLDCFYRR